MAWSRRNPFPFLTRKQGRMPVWVIGNIDSYYKFHADNSETCEKKNLDERWMRKLRDAKREKVEARIWLWWGSPLLSYSAVLSDSVLLIGHLIYCQIHFRPSANSKKSKERTKGRENWKMIFLLQFCLQKILVKISLKSASTININIKKLYFMNCLHQDISRI